MFPTYLLWADAPTPTACGRCGWPGRAHHPHTRVCPASRDMARLNATNSHWERTGTVVDFYFGAGAAAG